MSALGASGATLSNLTQEDLVSLTSDPEKQMPYTAYKKTTKKEKGKSPQRKSIHKTIPREEWGRRHCTIDGVEKIANRLDGFTDTNLIRSAFTADNNSHIGFSVKVLYETITDGRGTRSPKRSFEEVQDHLPNKVTGQAGEGNYEVEYKNIPVFVEKLSSENVSFETYVPGGVYTIPKACQDSFKNGTLCATFNSDNNGDGWITAAHVAKCETNSVAGEMIHDNDVIGDTTDVYYDGVDIDVAFVDSTSGEVPTSKISNTDYDGYDYSIAGRVTNSTLENNVGNTSYELKTSGFTTNRLSGYVTDMTSFGSSAVYTNHSVDNGDSGGPLFEVKDDGVYIAGVIAKKTNQGGCKSTTAETTENKLGGQFY